MNGYTFITCLEKLKTLIDTSAGQTMLTDISVNSRARAYNIKSNYKPRKIKISFENAYLKIMTYFEPILFNP